MMDQEKPKVIKTVKRLINATSMHHIDLHMENGLIKKRVYIDRDDAEENINKIYGLD